MSRATCKQCNRPIPACYCDALVSIDNAIPVLILQHPSESKHPYNTARILTLCLSHCELEICEQIPEELRHKIESTNAVLVFPELAWLDKARPDAQPINLMVVIDGSWNKAKKILHLNPWLQRLPRMALSNLPASEYQIRKSSMADGLSTIESASYALLEIDSSQDYLSLLKPFKRMVSLEQQHHPLKD